MTSEQRPWAGRAPLAMPSRIIEARFGPATITANGSLSAPGLGEQVLCREHRRFVKENLEETMQTEHY